MCVTVEIIVSIYSECVILLVNNFCFLVILC